MLWIMDEGHRRVTGRPADDAPGRLFVPRSRDRGFGRPTVEPIDEALGRIETRRIHLSEDMWCFEGRKRWSGPRTFVALERERSVDDQATDERAEFIDSLPSSATDGIARAAKGARIRRESAPRVARHEL